ncbi:MAG: hypothetical protein Q8M95_15695 [Candidatus Methanoperedens sp.]|nr:hypothetical protein [Candidatus Methanoperedens sp.]
MSKEKTRVLVVFYSMTGNVAKLAKEVANGASGVTDTDVRIRQVDELIPKDKWNDVMKGVKEELKDIPMAAMEDLEWAVAERSAHKQGRRGFHEHQHTAWRSGDHYNHFDDTFAPPRHDNIGRAIL